MGNDAKIVGQIPSAPPEWNVALRDVVFSGLDNFNKFLAGVGATADQLEFDAVAGRSKGLNGAYSAWNRNGDGEGSRLPPYLLQLPSGSLAITAYDQPNRVDLCHGKA